MGIVTSSSNGVEAAGRGRGTDFDAPPQIPWDNGKLVKHREMGVSSIDPGKVKLFTSDRQQGDGTVLGHKLRKVLEDVKTLNANVLDHYIACPEDIPVIVWDAIQQGCYVYFWATEFHHPAQGLCVRCMYMHEGRLRHAFGALNLQFDSRDLAVYLED